MLNVSEMNSPSQPLTPMPSCLALDNHPLEFLSADMLVSLVGVIYQICRVLISDKLYMQCMEESGCTLPVLRELSGLCQTVFPLVDIDHKHGEGCGHSQISHGDHFDWLVPLKDGSFLLSHPQVQNGLSSFIEHGRLINRGKTLAKLNLRPKLVDLFSYESPKQKGYASLPQFDKDIDARKGDSFQIVEGQLDDGCTIMPSASVGRNVVQGGMMKVDIPANYVPVLCRTTLDVMGICCPSEVPLIKKLLDPLPGVEDVFVNVTTKTVLVSYDQLLVTDVQLGANSNPMPSPAAHSTQGFFQFPEFSCFWDFVHVLTTRHVVIVLNFIFYLCSESFEWSTFERQHTSTWRIEIWSQLAKPLVRWFWYSGSDCLFPLHLRTNEVGGSRGCCCWSATVNLESNCRTKKVSS